jgi:hypothetical protein
MNLSQSDNNIERYEQFVLFMVLRGCRLGLLLANAGDSDLRSLNQAFHIRFSQLLYSQTAHYPSYRPDALSAYASNHQNGGAAQ